MMQVLMRFVLCCLRLCISQHSQRFAGCPRLRSMMICVVNGSPKINGTRRSSTKHTKRKKDDILPAVMYRHVLHNTIRNEEQFHWDQGREEIPNFDGQIQDPNHFSRLIASRRCNRKRTACWIGLAFLLQVLGWNIISQWWWQTPARWIKFHSKFPQTKPHEECAESQSIKTMHQDKDCKAFGILLSLSNSSEWTHFACDHGSNSQCRHCQTSSVRQRVWKLLPAFSWTHWLCLNLATWQQNVMLQSHLEKCHFAFFFKGIHFISHIETSSFLCWFWCLYCLKNKKQ